MPGCVNKRIILSLHRVLRAICRKDRKLRPLYSAWDSEMHKYLSFLPL